MRLISSVLLPVAVLVLVGVAHVQAPIERAPRNYELTIGGQKQIGDLSMLVQAGSVMRRRRQLP